MAAPAEDIVAFLERDREKDLLRFTTAGSVDDGKSTLIGRLLHDSKSVYEDQLAAVKNSKVNRAGGAIDFSLLTDGLRAEREQGITIDVAYRYFSTAKRKFIIADTPGHEQYTRNMATGASTADLAVVLIDARNGVLPQSRRHAYIAALLGIEHIVVAVNKMDLVGYSRQVFESIREEFGEHLRRLGVSSAHFIPISALNGDNVVTRSGRMPWYSGESLLEHLETVPVARRAASGPLRFPVQYVLRPDSVFRGYAGQVASGCVRPGDTVMALPSGRTTTVRSIPTFDGELPSAAPPMSIALCLEHELDISRGDMLVDPARPPHVSRRLEAKLVWMEERPLKVNRPYLLKHTTQQVTAVVTHLHHRVDVNTLAGEPAQELRMNDIGAVRIETNRPLFFDAYRVNRQTGSFILIDPVTNATAGAGMIEETPRPKEDEARAAFRELEFRVSRLSPAERYARAGHYPATIWLTAREQLAYLLEVRLFERGCRVHVVAEHVETSILPELAQLLDAAGLITIFCASTLNAAERDRAEELVGSRRFLTFAPQSLDANDERAVEQICAELERRGIIPRAAGFAEGEGI
ncbi:MAG TPA: sulfate adenylyltransferase subunit CysN [Bryobacteraceae bacterium]|nr:sulfate adenylyltransferase subunit CysN [Bryobacteraceae bacterium]HOQ47059.1 sulfate adenylyltransferase subunit CysN [Bryobacteraceae bacterium]HPU71068.1 sulfate adenylyltransferase subunit CysN [Bryobacteraceae bacterium]